MDRVLTWLESEPVATRVGPVVAVIVGYLLIRGTIDQDTANLIWGIAAAVAGTAGVAYARAAVIPMAKLGTADLSPEAGAGDPPGGRHAE